MKNRSEFMLRKVSSIAMLPTGLYLLFIGLQNLRRYFELIVFQSYLQSTEPDTMQEFESVETYVKNRPGRCSPTSVCALANSWLLKVIKTFEKELLGEGIDALKPLERADAKDGVADPDEVTQVVVNRSGSILSASTILKSDFFSNLQKMALPECVSWPCLFTEHDTSNRRINGSPNFRRVPLTLRPVSPVSQSPSEEGDVKEYLEDGKMVCGRSVSVSAVVESYLSFLKWYANRGRVSISSVILTPQLNSHQFEARIAKG